MAEFLSGIQLNARFYREIVSPLLRGTPHAAARIGTGSDVLGFDSERSTDHGWGPQLVIVLAEDRVDEVRATLDGSLPETFLDWPVRYGWDEVPVTHHVEVTTLPRWCVRQLGVDATGGLDAYDWLVMPQQKLLEATAGEVYHDGPGRLTELRARLAWYPRDVWLWMIACQWRRVGQEEAFVGRAAEVGDELGSRLVAGRLVRELMRLWFLLARRYWPYSKWFGSAFRTLDGIEPVAAAFATVLAAGTYPERELGLARAYTLTAGRHNDVGITDPVDPSVRSYFGRPYDVIMANRFVEACVDRLGPELRSLPLVGSIDQVADSTDLLSYPDRARSLSGFYAALSEDMRSENARA